MQPDALRLERPCASSHTRRRRIRHRHRTSSPTTNSNRWSPLQPIADLEDVVQRGSVVGQSARPFAARPRLDLLQLDPDAGDRLDHGDGRFSLRPVSVQSYRTDPPWRSIADLKTRREALAAPRSSRHRAGELRRQDRGLSQRGRDRPGHRGARPRDRGGRGAAHRAAGPRDDGEGALIHAALRSFPPPAFRRPCRHARASGRRHVAATPARLEPAAREHQRAGRLGRPAAAGALARTGRHQRLRRQRLRGLRREPRRRRHQALVADRGRGSAGSRPAALARLDRRGRRRRADRLLRPAGHGRARDVRGRRVLRAAAPAPGRGRAAGPAAAAASAVRDAALREDRDGGQRQPHPLRDRVRRDRPARGLSLPPPPSRRQHRSGGR